MVTCLGSKAHGLSLNPGPSGWVASTAGKALLFPRVTGPKGLTRKEAVAVGA